MPFRQRLSQIKFDELIYLRKKVSTRSVCMCLFGGESLGNVFKAQ